MRRITATEVKNVRLSLSARQGNRCALCQQPLGTKAPLDPVLDHDHETGAVRGVLHRGCNSGLGKVENAAARYGYARNLIPFAMGLGRYLQTHSTNVTGLIHPTHKTDEEKRLLKNERARKARAKKSAAKKETT